MAPDPQTPVPPYNADPAAFFQHLMSGFNPNHATSGPSPGVDSTANPSGNPHANNAFWPGFPFSQPPPAPGATAAPVPPGQPGGPGHNHQFHPHPPGSWGVHWADHNGSGPGHNHDGPWGYGPHAHRGGHGRHGRHGHHGRHGRHDGHRRHEYSDSESDEDNEDGTRENPAAVSEDDGNNRKDAKAARKENKEMRKEMRREMKEMKKEMKRERKQKNKADDAAIGASSSANRDDREGSSQTVDVEGERRYTVSGFPDPDEMVPEYDDDKAGFDDITYDAVDREIPQNHSSAGIDTEITFSMMPEFGRRRGGGGLGGHGGRGGFSGSFGGFGDFGGGRGGRGWGGRGGHGWAWGGRGGGGHRFGHHHAHSHHNHPRGPRADRPGPSAPEASAADSSAPGNGMNFPDMMRGIMNHPFIQYMSTAARNYSNTTAAGAANNNNGEDDESKDIDTFSPPVDIYSTPREYVLDVALPGVLREDVGVDWNPEQSTLTIAGVVHRGGDEAFLKTMISSERRTGVFERKVVLPPPGVATASSSSKEEIDAEGISAKLDNGVLVIRVPKMEKEWTEVRKVDIL